MMRQRDAIVALSRRNRTSKRAIESIALLARPVEEVDSPQDAKLVLENAMRKPGMVERKTDFARLSETAADILYRHIWKSGAIDEGAKSTLRNLAKQLDEAEAAGVSLSDERLLYRAYASHQAGDVEHATTAYVIAATHESIAERALQGLRNVLAKDLPAYRRQLDG